MRVDDIKSICERVRPLAMEGCYLVTGASGFIGSYIVQTLLSLADSGKKIKVITPVRNPEKMKKRFGVSSYLTVLGWDMSSILKLEEPFDYVIHAASPMGTVFLKDSSYDTMKQNLMGCVYLLDLCKEVRPEKVLYIGSASSYGSKIKCGKTEPVSEDTVGEFASMRETECYSISKLAGEYLMSCAAKQMGIHAMAVRLFSVYGPGMSMEKGAVFADLFYESMLSENLVIHGDGTPIRNFGYITDIVVGIFFALYRGNVNEVYNIGSLTENYSIYEFAKKLVMKHPKKLEIVIHNLECGKSSLSSSQIPNVNKMVSFGWRSCVTLDEGIDRMYEYYGIEKKS